MYRRLRALVTVLVLTRLRAMSFLHRADLYTSSLKIGGSAWLDTDYAWTLVFIGRLLALPPAAWLISMLPARTIYLSFYPDDLCVLQG